MIHPALAVFSVIVTFVISFVLFSTSILEVEQYFFVSIPILISIYTLIAIYKDHDQYLKRKWLQDPIKIAGLYLFWGTLAYLLCLLYEKHSFYSQSFPYAKNFVRFYFDAYLWVGIPYFVLTEKFRSSTLNYLSDPYLLWVSFYRKILRGHSLAYKRLWKNRKYRNFLVSSVLRIHFIGLMVTQMFATHQSVTKALQDNQWEYSIIISALTALVWSIDANNASIGYFWESKFTKTRFKEMDPYPLHWLVTIGCYLPFSFWVSTFIPSMLGQATPVDYAINAQWFYFMVDSVGLFFLFGYIWAGTSLYFSTSNMAYKAIQTRGPYALVRHPATFFKLGFFTILFFKFSESYTLLNFIAFSTWMLIYVGRVLCEERFLSRFPDYQAYKLKTKYRIIPGLF